MKLEFEITDINKEYYPSLLQSTWDELKGSYKREDFIDDNLEDIKEILETLGYELNLVSK